ncbi:hypothetical protein T06_14577 [Trichinella sp. T6]|nr:hypothetical protein T06_14577 [Trichinella sp. T6]
MQLSQHPGARLLLPLLPNPKSKNANGLSIVTVGFEILKCDVRSSGRCIVACGSADQQPSGRLTPPHEQRSTKAPPGFLQLIIDEQGKTDTMASKWMMALRGEESSAAQVHWLKVAMDNIEAALDGNAETRQMFRKAYGHMVQI